jgi:hypothetical protein
MKRVALDEIAVPASYAALRAAHREAVIAHKRDRRLPVGDRVTLVFEDRETLRFQIQEMVWIERIHDPVRIQEEIDVYNELVPGGDELTATLFVEITDVAEIRPELDRLIGIDEHVALVLDGEVVRARFDPKQLEEERISAVQYIRFPLAPALAERLADAGRPASLRIDHPNYRCEAPLPPALRRSLCRTLADAGEPLLAVPPEASAARQSARVLFQSGRVRALQGARGPGHVLVEALDPDASLLGADPALLDEALAAVRRAARDLVREFGGCRIQTEVDPRRSGLRWHLFGRTPA